jgi:hypothetical protein
MVAGLGAGALELRRFEARTAERLQRIEQAVTQARGSSCVLPTVMMAAAAPAATMPRPALAAAPAADGAGSRAATVREAEPEPPTLSPQQAQALATAQTRLRGAMERGRIDPEDVATLREQLAKVGPTAETRELKRQLAVAYNSGRLVASDPSNVLP